MLPTNFRSEYDFRTIGRNLKRLRTENKLSAEYVKDYLRLCSVQAVYKWERGESLPQADTFIALLELYGVDSFREVLYNKKERESESSPFNVVSPQGLRQSVCATLGAVNSKKLLLRGVFSF